MRVLLVVLLVAGLGGGLYFAVEEEVIDLGQGVPESAPRESNAPTHGCDGARTEPDGDLRAAERATLCLLNAERRARGLRPLRVNARLRRAAVAHTRDMVERRFFQHVNPDGVEPHDRIVRAGYPVETLGGATGENLGTGESSRGTPAEMVFGWMRSPGHRKNILSERFQEIGIAVVPRAVREDGRITEGATYTTTFGALGAAEQ